MRVMVVLVPLFLILHSWSGHANTDTLDTPTRRLVEAGYSLDQAMFGTLLEMIRRNINWSPVDAHAAYRNLNVHVPLTEKKILGLLNLIEESASKNLEHVDQQWLAQLIIDDRNNSKGFSQTLRDRISQVAVQLPLEEARRRLYLALLKHPTERDGAIAALQYMIRELPEDHILQVLIALDLISERIQVQQMESVILNSLKLSDRTADYVFLFASGAYINNLTPGLIEAITNAVSMFPEDERSFRIRQVNDIRERHWLELLPDPTVPSEDCQAILSNLFGDPSGLSGGRRKTGWH